MRTSASQSAGMAVGLGVMAKSSVAWARGSDTIRIAQVGIRGRGQEHLMNWNRIDGVEVAAICDVDESLIEGTMKRHFDKRKLKRPYYEKDLRKVLEDKNIDVISVATPNHWHCLMGVWACQAGKHVYVEKPCSHNIFEGRQLANAARKYNRIVQHGTQIRSNPGIQEAIKHLHDGLLGEVYMARGLCYKWRPSIGKQPDRAVPKGVDYDLWLGPAQERAFSNNRFHYNWHWHWAYGNGDIGNQGVHQLDVARWGLGVDLPEQVMSMGSMYLFEDDKEVPNTISTTYSYPSAGKQGKMVSFDTRPWMTNDEHGAKIGNIFYGSEGYMVIDSYTHYETFLGRKGEPGPSNTSGNDSLHYVNFIEAVRKNDGNHLNAPIEEGHKSAALCHLALISTQLKRGLEFDPTTETFKNDAEANKLLTRDYREPFVVPTIKA